MMTALRSQCVRYSAMALFAVLACATVQSFGAQVQAIVAGTNSYHVFQPGQPFEFTLFPNLISGSAPADLGYRWIDYQGNALSSPVSLTAGVGNTIQSPSESMDVGYYGLQLLGTGTSFNPLTNNRNELGFSVLPAITNRTINSNSFFGMVQHDYNDPYVDPGYIKTRTNVHAYNSSTGVVSASSWQSQIGDRYAQGQLEIPLAYKTPWPSSDNSPIPQSQLDNLQSVFEQYMSADERVPAWELGLEEQHSNPDPYYWENLRAKFQAFKTARDNVFPEGGGPKLGYQLVNYRSYWIDGLFSSPPTDPGGPSAGEEIDFLAVHPYDWTDFRDAEQWHDSKFDAMKSQLTGFGKQDLPIWYTEGGAPINDADVATLYTGSVSIPGRSRADHPRFMVKLHLEALDSGVEQFTWYNYQDRGTSLTDVEDHFGLVDYWDFPKPSYAAYANMVNSLKNLDFDSSEVLTDGVTVYRFSEGDSKTVVAWSPLGTMIDTDLSSLFGSSISGSVEGTSIVGSPLMVAGQLVSIGEDPLYLTYSSIASADFDNDGDVDGHDFLTWQRGYGNDYDANGLTNWQNEFGSPGTVATANVVPEPTAWVLISMIGLVLSGVRDSRRIVVDSNVDFLST